MASVSVRQFADVLKVPTERLVAQLRHAGISINGPDEWLDDSAKLWLLSYLRRTQAAHFETTIPARRLLSREREILRVGALLGKPAPTASDASGAAADARSARDEILTWAERQVGRLPKSAWEFKPFERLTGGRTCIGAVLGEPLNSLWALRVDTPDRDVAQRTWTVEVSVGYRAADQRALFGLRLIVNTPEQELLIDPTVPGLIRQIASKCGLYCGPSYFEVAPWRVESPEHAELLLEFILNPDRRHPILACSIPQGADRPLLNAEVLSKQTLGIARVVVIPPDYCWALTRAFGKARSVFGGAIRAYMPGFSADANPFAHRLILADQLSDQEGVRRVSRALRWITANESLRRQLLGNDVLAFRDVRDAALAQERRKLQQEGAAGAEELVVAQKQIQSLQDELSRTVDEKNLYLEGLEQAEGEAKQYEQQCRSLQARIQTLIHQIRERGEDPDSGIELPGTWGEFADWCDDALAGRVALSARARREVRSPEYESPKTAAQCLLWLANDYREARLNGRGEDLQQSILDGIHNTRSGADKMELDFQGRHLSAEWHIKNGGNTRDPRRCLRVYYAWDEQSQQVVIASMPGHLSTDAS